MLIGLIVCVILATLITDSVFGRGNGQSVGQDGEFRIVIPDDELRDGNIVRGRIEFGNSIIEDAVLIILTACLAALAIWLIVSFMQ